MKIDYTYETGYLESNIMDSGCERTHVLRTKDKNQAMSNFKTRYKDYLIRFYRDEHGTKQYETYQPDTDTWKPGL